MPAAETLDSSFTMNEQENLQQMDSSSFLPLILQAQDLVAKLENRVVELENDLETINETHEQERDQLLQEIGEKDEDIHNLKTKISRLEFGAREAIIVLARTVETLKAQNLDDDDDDNSKDDDDNATAVESTDLEGQFLDSIKLCLNYLKNSQTNKAAPKSYKKQNSMRRDSKIQPLNDDDESVHNVEINNNKENDRVPISENDNDNNDNSQQEPKDDIPRRESVCSEFSVSLDDVDLNGDEDIADYPDIDEEGHLNFDDETPTVNYDIDDDEELRHRQLADFAMANNSKTTLNSYVHDEPEGIDDRTEREGEETDQGEEESDDEERNILDHLPPQGPVPDLPQTADLCPNCNTLLAQLDQHIEERAYLKRDLSALAISLSEEQAIRAQLQISKENLELEIDDWVNAMFDKVNQMVFDEANTREELEILNREYKGKLDLPVKASGTRQDRLRELKLLLVHLDTTKQRQAPTSNNVNGFNRNSAIRRSIMSNSPVNSPRSSRIFGNFGHMSPSIFSTASVDEYMQKGRRVYIDGIVFEEFQEYVKSLVTSPAPTNSTPTHAFMKRCMTEDIQPCLFEGSSSWKSPFYKRRLLDAIMKNQCEIQTIYFSSSNSIPSTPMSSQISSTSNTRQNSYQEPPPSPKVKCGLCGHLRSCDFRMRLSGPDAVVPPSAATMSSRTSRFSVTGTPGWIHLDRFCRDRVVAVCDFYTYLSHLRQGLHANSAVWTMYKQCLKHRRKMNMARVGSVSMFEEEEALNNELLNNPEMEGMVVIVH